ncbi:hypothetical protein IWX90DRAFT_303037 [Phyllosticta citrichinensis]|uniref:Uncharacterized protein n=1 Tax=Phyllosticta citrichinensis TaxID=1130410 RepID=A0ABR1XL37_9PEZI
MHLLFGLSTLSLLCTTTIASPFALVSDLDAVPTNPSDDARLNGGRRIPFSEPLTRRAPDEIVAVNVDGSTGSANVTIGPAQPPAAAANANNTAVNKNASIHGPKAVALALQAKRGARPFSDGMGLIGLKEGDNMAGPMPPGMANINQDGQGEIGLRPGEISAAGIATALGLPGGRDYDHDRDRDRDDRDDDRDRDRAGPPALPPPPPGPRGDVDNKSGAKGVGSQPFAPFSMRYAAPPQPEQPPPQPQQPPQRDQREEEEKQRQQQEQERQRQEQDRQRQEEERQRQDRGREEQERQRQQEQERQKQQQEDQQRQERQRQKYPAITIGHGNDNDRPNEDVRLPQPPPPSWQPPQPLPLPERDIQRDRGGPREAPPPPPPQRAPAYAGGGYSGPDHH